MAMKFSRLTKPELEEIIKNANFTEDEEEIFLLLAKGLSIREISFRQSFSERTIRRRKVDIINKVNYLRENYGDFN